VAQVILSHPTERGPRRVAAGASRSPYLRRATLSDAASATANRPDDRGR
jgi:hypothetical protein